LTYCNDERYCKTFLFYVFVLVYYLLTHTHTHLRDWTPDNVCAEIISRPTNATGNPQCGLMCVLVGSCLMCLLHLFVRRVREYRVRSYYFLWISFICYRYFSHNTFGALILFTVCFSILSCFIYLYGANKSNM